MFRTVGCILVITGLLIPCAGCCCGAKGGSSGASASSNPSDITLTKFNGLKLGSSYEDACSAFGRPGIETTRMSLMGVTTVGYLWRNDGIITGQVTLTFQNNRLQSKNQIGLK